MQKLLLAEDVFDQLSEGKMVTIRRGYRDIKPGKLIFESVDKNRVKYVEVVMVTYCKVSDISMEDVKNDGFSSHEDLCEKMKRFYLDIQMKSGVTIVKFKV